MVRSWILALGGVLLAASIGWACGGGGGGSPGGGQMSMASGGGASTGTMFYGPGSDYHDMVVQQQMRQAYMQAAMAKAAAQAQIKQQKLEGRIARRDAEQARLAASRARRMQSSPTSPGQPSSKYALAAVR